jgi:hypothetical protein
MSDFNAVARTNKGTFAPGQSGNPGGRIGLPAALREQLEQGAPDAVSKLRELLSSKDERVALAAAEALLSRLYGKPAVALEASVQTESIGQLHLMALKELANRGRASC